MAMDTVVLPDQLSGRVFFHLPPATAHEMDSRSGGELFPKTLLPTGARAEFADDSTVGCDVIYYVPFSLLDSLSRYITKVGSPP